LAKYLEIAESLRERIRHGDYRLRGFPSHSELVSELGVNSRTVTKALRELVEDGHLVRGASGRFALPESDASRLHIGMVAPAYPTSTTFVWHRGADTMARERGWTLKFIAYTHWDDPCIDEALRGLDGVFFAAIADEFPRHVLRRIQAGPCPVVVLEEDTSAYDIPCVRLSNPASIHRLLDHLGARGHRQVDCLNVEPMNPITRGRIESWRLWLAAHDAEGELINDPVEVFGSAIPHAYRATVEAVRSGRLASKALFCATYSAAAGAMRALRDSGLDVGEEIDVCAGDDALSAARYLTPSLTCLRPPRVSPYIRACLNWFAGGGGDWPGTLVMQPAEMPLFVGESTGGAGEGVYERHEMADARSVVERV